MQNEDTKLIVFSSELIVILFVRNFKFSLECTKIFIIFSLSKPCLRFRCGIYSFQFSMVVASLQKAIKNVGSRLRRPKGSKKYEQQILEMDVRVERDTTYYYYYYYCGSADGVMTIT